MTRSFRIGLVATLAPFAVVLLASVVFAMDRASNGGEVLGAVTLADVRLGGLSQDEAEATIVAFEQHLQQSPIIVDVAGTSFQLMPGDIGFDLDEEAMVQRAMNQGREGGLATQFRWWLRHFAGGDGDRLSLAAAFDPDALDRVIDFWESRAIVDRPFEGGVTMDGTDPQPRYPEPGTAVDREASTDLIAAALVDLDRAPVTLPITTRLPEVTDEQVDEAVLDAKRLLTSPVTLSSINPPVAVEFPISVLADSLRSRVVDDDAGNPTIDLYFDFQTLRRFVDSRRDDIETPPMDAEIVIRPDDTPTIIPSRTGTLIEDGALPEAVMAAAKSITRSYAFPFKEGAPPDFSTEDAKALKVTDLLYTATTFYPCCGDQKNLNRIQNIHRIADKVNGALVLPGETWSLNDYVGQRTVEDGYAAAGAIIGDDVYCCDDPANIGGGVSQFTTTLYNAIFFSGVEDVDHTPHTLYFPRYPEVREATLGFPSPDLKFRNNLESAIYIKTEYTDQSVSVKFFGDNGGIEVEAVLGERGSFTEPHEKYEGNPDMHPGEEEVTKEGSQGWSNSVTRIITYPDGTTSEQTWWWTYSPFPKVIEVHPCELPEDAEDYDPDAVCPVQTPNLFGLTFEEASLELDAIGIGIAEGPEVAVGDPSLDGTVVEADPPGGSWLDPGEVVTVGLGVYTAPDGGGGGNGGG